MPAERKSSSASVCLVNLVWLYPAVGSAEMANSAGTPEDDKSAGNGIAGTGGLVHQARQTGHALARILVRVEQVQELVGVGGPGCR